MPIRCFFTNKPLGSSSSKLRDDGFTQYYHPIVGTVVISIPATLIILQPQYSFKRTMLAGICRNRFEKKLEPIKITAELLNKSDEEFLTELQIPKSFEEKQTHLLKYLFDVGSNEYKRFKFKSGRDYTLFYCKDGRELRRLFESLYEKNFLYTSSSEKTFHEIYLHKNGVRLSEIGIEEVKSLLLDLEVQSISVDGNLKKTIRDHLKKDEIEVAIDFLIEYFEKENQINGLRSVIRLSSELSSAKTKYDQGYLTEKEYDIERRKVFSKILSFSMPNLK